MPRRKRSKPTILIPHLRGPSNSNSSIKRKKKPKHVIITSNIYVGSCCDRIHGFIASIMKHFVIPSFAFSVIGCIFTSCYLNLYLQTHCLHALQHLFSITNNTLYATLSSYIVTISCILFSIVFYAYLYLIIALLLSPKGHDINSYSVGRSKFDPHRVSAFIYTCFQSFHTLSYFNSYFFDISSCLAQCKRISSDVDLSKMDYASYSINVFKRILSLANNRVLEAIENHQKAERNYLKQSHYDEIIKQNPDDILKCAQCKPQHMISIFNVHYDKNDPQQYANIFLPPSLSLSVNRERTDLYKKHMIPATPAIIFLVGGAWGSCDVSFSAAAASSFVASKIAFIYPTYRVYPDGDIQDMLSNINAIVEWTIKYAAALNINPNHLAIVGQSAGAHLGALSILRAHRQKSQWLKRVRFFCGLSGPYCIKDHYRWESNRGIENLSPMARCMKGIHNFAFYSPSVIAQEAHVMLATKYMDDEHQLKKQMKQMKSTFPHFLLIHSIDDYVVPVSSSRKLCRYLQKLNIECELHEYEQGTHYDSLFGLCDVRNPLFNRLVTDIATRLFICCRKYNEGHKCKQQEIDIENDTSDSKIEEEKEVHHNEEESEDVEKEQNEEQTTDSEDTDTDTDEEVENGACKTIEEFYEEQKEETVHVKARSVHLQQIASNVTANAVSLSDGLSEKLAVAQTIRITERITTNSNHVEDGDEVNNECNDTRAPDADDAKNYDTNMNLFKYEDVSIDPNKSEEALEFMKHLLLDMDKALDLVSSFNQATLQ